MNTFLATSLNTEIVLAILKGVCTLAGGSSDNQDHLNERDLFKISQTSKIRIDSITILNAKKWESGIKGEEINDPNEGRFDGDLMEEICLGDKEDY